MKVTEQVSTRHHDSVEAIDVTIEVQAYDGSDAVDVAEQIEDAIHEVI